MTHLIVLSSEPETMVFPSMLIATLLIAFECPTSWAFSFPVSMSHNLIRHEMKYSKNTVMTR